MHYHCEIWLPEVLNYSDATYKVERMLQNYHEESKRGFYDWYVIGGRYTGSHDNYNPQDDIKNITLCSICNGKGIRDNPPPSPALRGCNGCSGTGTSTKYSYVPHSEDVMEQDKVVDDLSCYTLIIAKGRWPKILHDFNDQVKPYLKSENLTGGCLVTVDCHN